jgi:hypothetical protein
MVNFDSMSVELSVIRKGFYYEISLSGNGLEEILTSEARVGTIVMR